MRALLAAAALCVAASLSGCASVDESLFGRPAPVAEPSTTPAPEVDADQSDAQAPAAVATAAAPPTDQGATGQAETAGTLPPPDGGETVAAPIPQMSAPEPAVSETEVAPASASPVVAPIAAAPAEGPAVGAVTILPGTDTGTAVGHTITSLRASLQDAANRTLGAGQQYGRLRNSSAQQLAIYFQAQAQISARLQIGTTRANPQLVAQWNTAQAALDQLTANINALSALIAQINGYVPKVRALADQIQATVSVPGGVEEDHRQLGVMEDEANQVIVVLERLGRDAPADLRRQTLTLTNERARLAQLANGIKAGDLYASDTAEAAPAVSAAPVAPAGGAGMPIVTIRRTGSYQKILYDALTQALKNQPTASFHVIGVSPTRGSAAALQVAQNDARHRAQEVMHTMTEMGVPAARMDLSSATDPSLRASEVRVFLR
ncbi:MAG: hypothetical protein ACJ8EL_07445 [Rhizomicrobium sp.]